MNELDLLKKNELKFRDITLDHANLTEVAATVARIMDLDDTEVLVTDYLDNVMTLDILRSSLYPHQILAKKDVMLTALAQLPGVQITDKTTVFSEGMLGWIAADAEQATRAMQAAEAMTVNIKARLAKRAIIFSTGAEVLEGDIEDTNRATLTEALESKGFSVGFGGVLRDDQELIAGSLRKSIFEGYSLLVTTGGVGAESKDCTVEAMLDLDPQAATPYICTFTKGHGRHVKDGVRIGVGTFKDALIVCLPGPNDEVRASLPLLLGALDKNSDKASLAESLAANLRQGLRQKMQRHGH